MEQIEKSEIKRWLKKGFKPELISLEFNIPIEVIHQCQKEISYVYSHQKLEQMREKYNKLTSESTQKEYVTTIRSLGEEENEKVEQVIKNVEEKLEEIKNVANLNQRKKAVIDLIKELNQIKNYPLTFEQTEKICNLIYAQEINNLMVHPLISMILQTRKVFTGILTKHIEVKQREIENEEELKKLALKITPEMVKVDYMSTDFVKGTIWRKISKMKQEQAVKKMKNNVPSSIESIIVDLANGELKIEDANRIVDEEAKKKLASKPKNNFGITEEQERKQILHQIRIIIKEQGEKYQIQNPEITVRQMQELCGGEIELSISSVIKNLIDTKKYDKARNVYKIFANEEAQTREKYFRNLQKEINNAEIRDFALVAINMKGTFEEESEYFETLERGLKKGKIKLEDIVLEKSQEGVKKITLADVWPEKFFDKDEKTRYN